MIGGSVPRDLDDARYIAFVSHRKDGTPVSTAVWVVPFEDGYAFTTDPDAWKVKRILRDSIVTVQASNVRGRPKKGAPVHHGRAVLLVEEEVRGVQLALRRKYWFAYRVLFGISEWRATRRGGSSTAGTAAIKVVLDD